MKANGPQNYAEDEVNLTEEINSEHDPLAKQFADISKK